MPDVGLFSGAKPLSADYKVVIKYSVEVNGLTVYQESYDADKIDEELREDEAGAVRNWARRIKCLVCCRKRSGFSGCLTRCLTDGKCADCGHKEEQDVETKVVR
jgi:hypothetical protein